MAAIEEANRIFNIPDRIAAIYVERDTLYQQLQVIEDELDLIRDVPRYIHMALIILVREFGPNEKEEARIREGLIAGLTSEPKITYNREYLKYDYDSDYITDGSIYEDIERISYKWHHKEISYRVVCGDEKSRDYTYRSFPIWKCTDQPKHDVHEMYNWCIKSKCWSDVVSYDIRYIPILVAYVERRIERYRSLRKN